LVYLVMDDAELREALAENRRAHLDGSRGNRSV
jgi:hypothetical protein